jgi:hypothetical protein
VVSGNQRPFAGLDATVPNVARMYDYYLGGRFRYARYLSAARLRAARTSSARNPAAGARPLPGVLGVAAAMFPGNALPWRAA